MINLIILGLVIVPWLYAPGYDTRSPKEYLAFIFASAIGLWHISQCGLRPAQNKWLLLLMFFLSVSMGLAPMVGVEIAGNNISGFWMWKPLSYSFAYLLMYLALSSWEVDLKQLLLVFSVVFWCAFLMSVYVCLQAVGIDQYWKVKPLEVIGTVNRPALVGMLGNPTIVSAWIAICVPIAYYLKRWIGFATMLLAVLLTGSMVSIGACCLSVLYLILWQRKGIILAICLLGLVLLALVWNPDWMSGRLEIWKDTISDARPITGRGLGSFEWLYGIGRNSQWHQVHNEYIEFYYNTGIVGLLLLFSAVAFTFRYFSVRDPLFITLYASVGASCLIALGSFPWQLGATVFYTVLFVGLIENLSRRKVWVG